MNLNEITFVLFICWSSLFILWLYLGFKKRNLEEALSIYTDSAKELSLILKEQSEDLNKRIKSLKKERDKLLEDYDEPDKTLH